MKNKNGFTIIELLVVIVVIGILASITILAYTSVQQQARDKQRMTSSTVVSSGLEKYFDVNGEYPSVAKVTNSDATAAKQLLGLTDLTSLSVSGSTVNLWKTGAASSVNRLTYSGNTDVSASCTSGAAATDICTDYKIQFYNEQTKTVTTITSNHTSGTITAPPPTTPSQPTLAAALNAGNVVATASAITCGVGASGQYAYQTRTNNGAWSGYGAWTATGQYSTPTAQGTKFGFMVKTHCVASGVPSADSTPSTEATYTGPINAPAVPTISNSTAGNTTTWSWVATACPAGTTAYYAANSGNDYDTTSTQNWWMGWQADQTTLTWPRDTTSQGYLYGTKIRAKCANAFATSPWSGDSNVSTWLRNVVAPGTPTNWSYAVVGGRTGWDWYWTEPTCGLGTNSAFQWDGYIGDTNNTNGWSMYWTDKGPYNHYWYGATAPSWQDPGWYNGGNLELQFNGTSTPYNINVYAAITYRCQNPLTLRTAVGARAQAGPYNT